MADVDIVVDSGDLKAAIDLLNDYGISFTKMVNQVQTEGNRLSRASKATALQVEQAWENAQKVLDNNRLQEAAAKEQQILKRRGQNWKQFFQQDYMQPNSNGITKASSLLVAKLEEDAAEEKRILALRSQNWKQFFTQDFMKSSPASSMGAPTASNSALADMYEEMDRAAKVAAASTKELERETRELTAAYNPLLAAEQKYLAMKSQIARASELGIIDAKQEAAALKQLEKEYQALSKGVYLAGSRFNQFGEQAGISGKSANRFGMYAQQAGYQVGDFAVQLQSGTNAGVAFSQQAAQLAGLIPGLAGAITTFAAIGLGLLIQNLTRGKKEAEETYAQLSAFEDLESTFKSVGVSFETSMVQSISRVRKEYGEFIADVAKFSLQKEMDQLKANLGTVMDKATPGNPDSQAGFFGTVWNSAGLQSPDAVSEAMEKADAYNEMLKEVQAAQDRLFNGSINSKSELVTAYQEVYETMKGIPGITQEILNRFVEVGQESGIAAEQIKNIGDSWTSVNDKAREAFELYKEKNYELLRSGELLKVEQQYGKDSIQYLKAQHDQQIAILRSELESADVKDTLIDKIIDMQEAQYNIAEATYSWGNSLGYVKNQIAGVAAILASIGGGMISNAEKFTTAKLIREGATRVEAEKQVRYASEDRKYEIQKQQNLSQYGKIIGSAINAGLSVQHQGGRNADEALLAAYELDAERTKAAKGSKGGKGSKRKLSDAEKDAEKAAEKLEEFFEQFKLGMEQQERLLGVYGEQREELEKVIEIENRLGDARHLVSQKQIEAMANEELALERKLEREQELYELGSQNVENLLMTIVDGTSSIEDAFKAMFASIIREVYQQQVAKGAADWAGNALVSLFSAKGNAFGTGGVKMFANGGVVDSPTLFNYSGGTGMMGEAGPEAIMPLKRNSQGKLGVQVSGGSSGNVSIQQNFHISANGDESVRTIIRQEMPSIANAAKMAVIEGKRRNERGL